MAVQEIKIGTIIGKWTVIEIADKPIENKTNLKYWKCVCSCKNHTIKIINEQTLKHNKSLSCGCSRLEDLTGQKFGRLTVIEKDEVMTSEKKETYWKCQCDCGNTVSVSNGHLKDKKKGTKSCGCLHLEKVLDTCKKYNTYVLFDNYGIGSTSKGEEFSFDIEDYDKIKDYCWWKNAQDYIVSHLPQSNKIIRMNRLLMNCNDENVVVDHINGDTMNNKKSNLRICTQQQNTFNSAKRIDNTSGVTGVWFDNRKDRNKWVAEIKCDDIKHFLGSFNDIQEAINARKEAEQKYFGEYTRLTK